MPLSFLFPSLPWPALTIALNVLAGLGAVLLAYGVFIECERRQDAIFATGAGCLLIYSLWIGNTLLSLAMGGFMLASLVEIIEILLGRHQHSRELIEEYKHPQG